MQLELTQPAKNLLAERGFDPVLGARPLRRTIQREIEDVLAEKMLFGEVGPGQIVLVDVEGEGPTATFTFTGQKICDAARHAAVRDGRRSADAGEAAGSRVPTTPTARPTCRSPPTRSSSRRRAGASPRRGLTRRDRSALQGECVGVRAGARRPGRSSTRPARQRLALVGVGPGGVEPRAVHRAVGVAEHGQQPAAALAVGAGPGLAAAGRSVVRRVAGGAPRAPVGDRAGVAARVAGGADQRAELHHRDRPGRGGRRRRRAAASAATSRSARVTDGGGNSTPGDRPGEHPADVGVEHDVPLAEGEAGDRRRRCSRRRRAAPAGRRTTPAPRRRARSTIAVAAACRRSARRG